MPNNSTKPFSGTTYLKAILLNACVFLCLLGHAQDTTAKAAVDSNAHKTAIRPKEITKLDDLNLPGDLYARIKAMKPNQLLVFREDFTYNIKAEDNIDYSITVKLGFSQDMITGIIKWVPLYNNTNEPPEITKIKIKVQFCCTTPIDTLHKKQHCGKMSELNDFEDNEHCKDWVQKDDAKEAAENAASFGRPGGVGGKGGKKGGGVTGQTSPGGEGFGKPSKEDKKKKKGKDIQEPTDSTNYRPEGTEKPTKEDKKKKGKETTVQKDSTDEGSYGKPLPPAKESKPKKGKTKEKEKQAPTDSTNYRPEPPLKEEKKEEEVKKDSTEDAGFGKPDEKKGKKKKKG